MKVSATVVSPVRLLDYPLCHDVDSLAKRVLQAFLPVFSTTRGGGITVQRLSRVVVPGTGNYRQCGAPVGSVMEGQCANGLGVRTRILSMHPPTVGEPWPLEAKRWLIGHYVARATILGLYERSYRIGHPRGEV